MSTIFLSLPSRRIRCLRRACAVAFAALTILGQIATPARAELVWKAISVNFTNSSNLLDPLEAAGNAAEAPLGFTNWNNMTSGTSLTGLTMDDGFSSFVDLSIYTGGMNSSTPYPILSYNGTQFGSNPWSSGVTMNTPATAPSSGNSSQNKLYASGAVVLSTNGPVGTFQNGIFSFSGLNAAFPNGYKVYVYQSAGAGNNTGTWFGGGIYASGTTSGTRDFGPANYISSGSANNVNMTFGTAGSTTNAWGARNNTAFNGTFADNKFVTITKTGGGLVTSDVFALTNAVYGQFTGVTSNQLITGVQIVGQVEVVPEPPVVGIAAAGAACFVVLRVIRRRARRSAGVSDSASEERLGG